MAAYSVGGTLVDLTKDKVRDALVGVVPEPVIKHGVEIGGQVYPVVQALEAASGVPRRQMRSARARAVLKDLGFRLILVAPRT